VCLSRSCGRYENPDVALNTGMILREMLRHEVLAKALLYSDRLVGGRHSTTALRLRLKVDQRPLSRLLHQLLHVPRSH
jgi:hypothetical protein